MTRSAIRLAGALAASGLLAAVLGGSVLAQSPAAASVAPGSAAPGPRVIVLNIGATSIDPASVEVLNGETVTFQAMNVSPAEVELIVGLKPDVDADSGDSLKEAEHIAAGGSGSVTYTFDGTGPYAFGDQLPGHYAAGAKGDIVLVDALSSQVPASPAAGGPRVIVLNIGATSIDPASVEVLNGETVTFQAMNVSPAEVELIVGLKPDVDADSGDSLKEAEHIAAGGSGSVTYTFDGTGPYAFGDQLPGHYAAGAKGDIVLVDALSQ